MAGATHDRTPGRVEGPQSAPDRGSPGRSAGAVQSPGAAILRTCRLADVRRFLLPSVVWVVFAAVLACAGDAAPTAPPLATQSESGVVPASSGLVTTAPASGPAVAGPAVAGPETSVVTPLRRHTVQADGHPIAVYSKAPPHPRAALLLVHGRTWSALPDFDLQVVGAKVSLMDAMAAAGVATYAIDLRGYGATPRDATGFATPERSAADVAEVLRFVETDAGAGRPYLLGWSLGALVSALTVQTWPELAAGVVLYGHPCRGGTAPAQAAAEPTTPRRATNTAASAASDFITPGSVSRAVIDAFVTAALQADPVRADWRGGAAWDGLRFAALRVPVLVINGERDPVSARGCLTSRFAELEGIDRRWVVLAGGDHAAHLERSAPAFVAAVLAFITAPASL